MPRPTRPKKPAVPEELPSQTPATGADESANPPIGELEWLYELDEGTQIMVTRKEPSYAKGYLGTVAVDPNASDGVLERIRAKWGGGVFLLQPKGRQKNGHRYFAGGSARVTIAGAASLDGREYDHDGHLMPREQPAAPPLYPAYPGYPPPQHAPPGGGVGHAQLLSLVERAMTKGGQSGDLAGVITALSGMQREPLPTPEPVRVNTLSDMRAMMEMMTLMRQNLGAPAEVAEVAPAVPSDPMEKLLQLAAMKFMGGGSEPPKPAPANSPGPQPSPHHVWHPARGWLLLGKGSGPPARPPTVAPPQHATHQAAAGHDSSPPAEPPADDFTPPIQPAEFIGELEAKSPEEQTAFIKSVLGMIESRPELAASFMSVANAAKPDEDAAPGGGLSAV